jgi:hypothetical protein
MECAADRFRFGTRAFLWGTAVPSAPRDVGEALAGHPEVSYVGATAGVLPFKPSPSYVFDIFVK